MDCRDRRYCKTYFAVDNRLYAFVQFDRPKIENHLLTPESMKKRKSGFTLSGKNLAAGNRIFLYVATRFFLRYNEKNGGRKRDEDFTYGESMPNIYIPTLPCIICVHMPHITQKAWLIPIQ